MFKEAAIWLTEADTAELVKFFAIAAGLSIFISTIIAFKLRRYPLLAVELSVFVVLLISPWICTYAFLLEELASPNFDEYAFMNNYDSMVFLTYLIAGPVSIWISFCILPFFLKKPERKRDVGRGGKLKKLIWFFSWLLLLALGVVWFLFGSIEIWEETKTGRIFFRLLHSNAFGLLTAFVAAVLLFIGRTVGLLRENE